MLARGKDRKEEREKLARNTGPTGFLKVPVERPPGVSDAQQVLLQGVQIRVRTVALGKLPAALAPAVAPLTHKLALGLAADVVESRLDEEALQVSGQDHLQPCQEHAQVSGRH